jgi:protein involved in polysaccharide export with SLBB domain
VVIRLVLALLAACALAHGEDGYRLFPGDLLRIEVYGHDDLAVEARVPPGGEITFPLIGGLAKVAGRSPEALASEIRSRLADGFIRDPSVTVQVREYGVRSASVVGAVKTPGAIRLDPLRSTGALQAIGAAGGFDEDADRGAAQVLREDPAKPGAKLALAVPPPDAAQSDVDLQHGDLIVVPRADRIFVLGQVQYPRAVPLPAREVLTVSKAISLAGGFGRFSRDDKVQLLRRGAQPQTVDVRAVLAGSADAADPELRAGDTVFVPESRF